MQRPGLTSAPNHLQTGQFNSTTLDWNITRVIPYWVTCIWKMGNRGLGKAIGWGTHLLTTQQRGNWNKLYKGTKMRWKLMHCYLSASQISYLRWMAEKRCLEEMRQKHQLWEKNPKTRLGRVPQMMLISRWSHALESCHLLSAKNALFSCGYMQNDKVRVYYFCQLFLYLKFLIWSSPVKASSHAPFWSYWIWWLASFKNLGSTSFCFSYKYQSHKTLIRVCKYFTLTVNSSQVVTSFIILYIRVEKS